MRKVKKAKSKRLKAEQVGPKKEKLFGQADEIPKPKVKKQFNKLAFDKGRKSHFGMK